MIQAGNPAQLSEPVSKKRSRVAMLFKTESSESFRAWRCRAATKKMERRKFSFFVQSRSGFLTQDPSATTFIGNKKFQHLFSILFKSLSNFDLINSNAMSEVVKGRSLYQLCRDGNFEDALRFLRTEEPWTTKDLNYQHKTVFTLLYSADMFPKVIYQVTHICTNSFLGN